MQYIPSVIDGEGGSRRVVDLYSRLLEDRIIIVSGVVSETMADSIVSQLLYLDAQSNKTIFMYINSPGGEIDSGMAIYDTMNFIKSDVETIVTGMAASMASFLSSSGTKGKRFALPHATLLIHQPLAQGKGQQTDMAIIAENLTKTRKEMTKIIAKNTGQSYQKVMHDTERDHYLSAPEAKEYGLIDDVITNK